METQNAEISTFKKEVLADCIKEWAPEDFIKVVIEGIDRIESSLPSLQTHAEKEAVLELYISNHETKNDLKDAETYLKRWKDLSDKYKNRIDDYKMITERQDSLIKDQSALIDEMSAFRKVQKNIIQQLQETLTNTEKIYPN